MAKTDHAKVVLAAIIPERVDLYREMVKEVTIEYFTEPVYGAIFTLLERYYQKVDAVLSRSALEDMLERGNADAGRRALLTETYDELFELSVDEADFRWGLHELKEDYAERNLKEVLKRSMEILTQGITEQRSGEIIQGQEDARAFLSESVANLDQEMTKDQSPHGDMRDEGDLILEEYQQQEKARYENKLAGVRFGIRELDEKVGGLQPGDLVISAGYSSDGKTSLCVQLAWSAAVEQGKNVLFLSTETVNTVIRRKLIARHSRYAKFESWQMPDGLNTKNLKEGSLTEPEKEYLKHVVKDFTDTESGYGHLYIHQVPRQASMEVVESILNSTQKKFPIDLVIIDYLALLRPLGARNTDRESLAGILKNAKQIATTFNKGAGVPIVSPWQVNRASKEAANSIGMYTSQSLAETAEATNTPDVIISILAPVDNTERFADITAQVLKNRDGETANGILLEVDYATSTFASKNSFSTGNIVFDTAEGFNSFI